MKSFWITMVCVAGAFPCSALGEAIFSQAVDAAFVHAGRHEAQADFSGSIRSPEVPSSLSEFLQTSANVSGSTSADFEGTTWSAMRRFGHHGFSWERLNHDFWEQRSVTYDATFPDYALLVQSDATVTWSGDVRLERMAYTYWQTPEHLSSWGFSLGVWRLTLDARGNVVLNARADLDGAVFQEQMFGRGSYEKRWHAPLLGVAYVQVTPSQRWRWGLAGQWIRTNTKDVGGHAWLGRAFLERALHEHWSWGLEYHTSTIQLHPRPNPFDGEVTIDMKGWNTWLRYRW